MSFVVLAGAAVLGVLAIILIMNRKAAGAISRKVSASGKRIVRIRFRPIRSPFVSGLSPLAFVYRVTTMAEGEASKAVVRLYAYDPGRWFSRHGANLRQFSGGVWRDA
jgi:hypothetical protein